MITASILFAPEETCITLYPGTASDKSILALAVNAKGVKTIRTNPDGSFTLVILPEAEKGDV